MQCGESAHITEQPDRHKGFYSVWRSECQIIPKVAHTNGTSFRGGVLQKMDITTEAASFNQLPIATTNSSTASQRPDSNSSFAIFPVHSWPSISPSDSYCATCLGEETVLGIGMAAKERERTQKRVRKARRGLIGTGCELAMEGKQRAWPGRSWKLNGAVRH